MGKFDAVYAVAWRTLRFFWAEPPPIRLACDAGIGCLDDRQPANSIAGSPLAGQHLLELASLAMWSEARRRPTALIYVSRHPTIKRYSYRDCRDESRAFAGALAGLGVCQGDRSISYLAG